MKKCTITTLDAPVWLSTANGPICVTQKAIVLIMPLQKEVECLVMLDTSPALSIGTFVMQDSYDFHWLNKSIPYLEHIHTKVITPFEVHRNVPHLSNIEAPCIDSDVRPSDGLPCATPGLVISGNEAKVAGDCSIADDGVAPPRGPTHSSGDDLTSEVPQSVAPPPEPFILSHDDRLKLEAHTTRHFLLHKPRNKFCDTCRRANVALMRACRREPEFDAGPVAFGDRATADHILLYSESDRGLNGSQSP